LAGKNELYCPEADVLGHVVPQEMGNDEMPGGSDTRMAQGVGVMKKFLAEGNRNCSA
jgi:hypothetical protein